MCFQPAFLLARFWFLIYGWQISGDFHTDAGVDVMGGFSMCLFSSKVDGNQVGMFPEKTQCVWFCLGFYVDRNSQNDKDFREGSR